MKKKAQWINRCVGVGLVISSLAIFSLLSTAQADDILIEKQGTIIIDKSKFWDLELYYLTVNNKVFTAGKSETIHVRAGKTVSIKCMYSVKTIKPSLITEQDVEKWGSGNIAYRVAMGTDLVVNTKIHTKFLPEFDMSTVDHYGDSPSMVWVESARFQWTPKMTDIGKEGFMALYTLDNQNDIKEYNEDNNSTLKVGPYITIIVTPPVMIEKETGITPKEEPKIEKKLVPKTTN